MKLTDLLVLLICAFAAIALIRSGEQPLVLIPLTIAAVFTAALLRANRVG